MSSKSGMSDKPATPEELALSVLAQTLRSTAIRCDCTKDQTCAEHDLRTGMPGIRRIVEDAVYVAFAQYVTIWVKPSWLRLIVSCCPISGISQEAVFRRLCQLKSDMDTDAMILHNRALKGEPTPFGAIHRESTCKWCTAPKEALDAFLSGS
jgi:hypothetical protein